MKEFNKKAFPAEDDVDRIAHPQIFSPSQTMTASAISDPNPTTIRTSELYAEAKSGEQARSVGRAIPSSDAGTTVRLHDQGDASATGRAVSVEK